MITKLLIAFSLMAICVAIHAMGLTTVFGWIHARLQRRKQSIWSPAKTLIGIASWVVFLHLLQILVWALMYAWRGAMPDFTTAAYFSAVTYTTTGYGDVVLPERWRLSSAVEALTGILMCGWSTGFFFAVVSGLEGGPRRMSRGPDA